MHNATLTCNTSMKMKAATLLAGLSLLYGLAFAGFLTCSVTASAAAASPQYVQYGRASWRFDDGSLPDEPQAMAQTPDGYIWIGSPSGIYRFDGVKFEKYKSSSPAAKDLIDIFSLQSDSHGRLLVGTGSGAYSVIGEKVVNLTGRIGRVNAIVVDSKDTVWIARTRPVTKGGGVCRIAKEKVECLGSPTKCAFAGSLTLDVAGNVWSGASNELCKVNGDDIDSIPIEALKSQRGLSGVQGLLANPDGSLTVGFIHQGPGLGLQRFRDGRFTPEPLPNIDPENLAIASVLRDSTGGVWIGTADEGLIHLHDGQADRVHPQDGLSGGGVASIIEDAEGDVWTVTTGGIDRFRRRSISSFGLAQGMPNDEASAVLTLRNGNILAGSRKGLAVITPGGITALDQETGLPGKAVTSMLEDHLGTVWLGIDDHVATWRDGRFAVVPSETGEPLRGIVGMSEGKDGVIWLLVSPPPKQRIFKSVNSAPFKEIPIGDLGSPSQIASDSQGVLWATFASGALVRFNDDIPEVVLKAQDVRAARGIFFLQNGLTIILSQSGLRVLRKDSLKTFATVDGLPCDDVLSAVHDDGNKLWVHLRCGYSVVSDEALAAWSNGSTERLRLPLFGRSEGALGYASSFQPAGTVSSDGKVWFATNELLQMIDPTKLPSNALPPPVHVESLTVDGHTFPTSSMVELPSLSKNVEISYAGLSFPDPRKVEFRYKLRGPGGTPWTDAGARRIAIFSRLPPGHYDFQVVASNNDGVWNPAGDHLAFVIPPVFYQTTWFRIIVSCIALLLLWTAVSVRIAMARRKMEVRMGERLLERDRIARELHDTLLQGVQSIALRFQIVADAMPNHEPAKELALSSLTKADSVMQEIREKVKDLREQETDSQTLAESIGVAYDELKQGELPSMRVNTIGTPRVLRSGIRSELISIAREVIFNSILHGNATEIVCDIRFGSRFSIVIQDNGCGLPPEVLAKGGRPGHWGLIGIRERAKKMGGTIRIESSHSKGTKIVLSLDSRLAYTDSSGLLLERSKATYRRMKRLANPRRLLQRWVPSDTPG